MPPKIVHCEKEAEIAVIQNEQAHIKVTLDKINETLEETVKLVRKIDKDVNNGINTAIKAVSHTVGENVKDIATLRAELIRHPIHNDTEPGQKKKFQFTDLPFYKQLLIVIPILIALKFDWQVFVKDLIISTLKAFGF